MLSYRSFVTKDFSNFINRRIFIIVGDDISLVQDILNHIKFCLGRLYKDQINVKFLENSNLLYSDIRLLSAETYVVLWKHSFSPAKADLVVDASKFNFNSGQKKRFIADNLLSLGIRLNKESLDHLIFFDLINFVYFKWSLLSFESPRVKDLNFCLDYFLPKEEYLVSLLIEKGKKQALKYFSEDLSVSKIFYSLYELIIRIILVKSLSGKFYKNAEQLGISIDVYFNLHRKSDKFSYFTLYGWLNKIFFFLNRDVDVSDFLLFLSSF